MTIKEVEKDAKSPQITTEGKTTQKTTNLAQRYMQK